MSHTDSWQQILGNARMHRHIIRAHGITFNAFNNDDRQGHVLAFEAGGF